MDTSTINAAITAAIKANGNNEITGPVLQSILLQIVAALNSGKQDTLVSGTNIKTVGGTSLIGAGDVALRKSLSVQRIRITLTGATLAAAATALGLSESEVVALFEGEYDELQVAQPDTGVCRLLTCEREPGDHTMSVYGESDGAVRFYADLASSPATYTIEFADFF